MPDRIAISLLSRENKADALPEEVMIHKTTGQILIKTTAGDIISFDSLNRIKSHIDNTTTTCLNLDIRGDMSSIEISETELPSIISYDTNILTNSIILYQNKEFAKTILSIDLDCIKLSDTSSLTGFDPIANIDFVFTKTGVTKTFNIQLPISDLNQTVIDHIAFLDSGESLGDFIISLDSIKFNKNILDIDNKNISILYSILVITE